MLTVAPVDSTSTRVFFEGVVRGTLRPQRSRVDHAEPRSCGGSNAIHESPREASCAGKKQQDQWGMLSDDNPETDNAHVQGEVDSAASNL